MATPNTPPSKTITYLWDDFNIIAETVVADSATNITYNVWGLDLDGTLQGAGGVGGLLAVVKDSATYIPAWDANGNITEYVAEDGSIVAHREYDPFGGTVVYTCQSAINNQQSAISFTHWFSTKPWCAVTGLSEYQYRKYSPEMGRWLSRDPTEEGGGLGVYGYVQNEPVGIVDLLGLAPPSPQYLHQSVRILGFQETPDKYSIEEEVKGQTGTLASGSRTYSTRWSQATVKETERGYSVTLQANGDYKMITGEGSYTFGSNRKLINAKEFSVTIDATYSILQKTQLVKKFTTEWRVYETGGCVFALPCSDGDITLSRTVSGFSVKITCGEPATKRKKGGTGEPITMRWRPVEGQYKLQRGGQDLTGWTEDLDYLYRLQDDDYVNYTRIGLGW